MTESELKFLSNNLKIQISDMHIRIHWLKSVNKMCNRQIKNTDDEFVIEDMRKRTKRNSKDREEMEKKLKNLVSIQKKIKQLLRKKS